MAAVFKEVLEDADIFMLDSLGHLILVEHKSMRLVFVRFPLERRILFNLIILDEFATADHEFLRDSVWARFLSNDMYMFLDLGVCSYRKSKRVLSETALDHHPSDALFLS